ncbi:nadh-cytochrome b5 reductase [Ophiostoma piceae UAMH 11346]|uniref:Nadh-cytochrome b5 reductase n=1 Tax=Ophiostoma piceae (strain UAMH 11346) TaxID=1262450 RepID=S3BZ47_OPHP1|nr:nadh-cytochrome b5 reductase [Ophiostoma piceae UAMH 11346]
MSLPILSPARLGLRPLAQQTYRLLSSQPSAHASLPARIPHSKTSSVALVAAAAVAVGAYVAYTRTASSARAETAGGKPPFASFGFRTLTLASSESLNHNVKHLRFDLPDPQSSSGLTVTSALLAITFPGGSWLPTLRPYTPINDADDRGHIDFFVKQYPGGKQSTYLHSLSPGDTVTFVRIPGYSWKANEQAHIGLVAGGQGITPCYQLLRGILCNPNDNTKITLVWGVNTEADILLDRELQNLQKQHPGRLTVKYVVSQPSGNSAVESSKGRVTSEVLKAAGVAASSGVGKIFLSGPPAMETALVARDGPLAELGYSKKDIHKF